MPLPAALLARLAKRGIVNENCKPVEADNAPEEEVFAEDYDDQRTPLKENEHIAHFMREDPVIKFEDIQLSIKGSPGCPNKCNIYHECNSFCVKKFGDGYLAPDSKYTRVKALLLSTYPLPDGWEEVFDPGTGMCYYWNCHIDLVSWYPPGHPKHVPSKAACVLREEMKLADSEDEESVSESEGSDNEEEDEVQTSAKKREMIEKARAKGRSKKRENDLDPMDPSAYSEVPRGTWSSGLGAEGKTGVDTTASGSLFQQRPLPSPGAILRARGKKH